ncbi:MAG: hypothetical protein KGJ10_07310 [Acidobacteriota bacterium]|nr:hypothetical protein [Acidobacteriota bacterium]MDE3222373.1 hypothetical protein [Acidobacteriota bacterium]
MALRRLVASLDARDDVAPVLRAGDLLQIRHGDAAMVAAAWAETWVPGVGLWMLVDDEHPASLVARDVATLSYLVDLGPLVIEASRRATAHAQIVRALLTNDEVNFANDVATLVAAYNRPAPRVALRVGSCERDVVTLDAERLALRRRAPLGERDAEVWTYGD